MAKKMYTLRLARSKILLFYFCPLFNSIELAIVRAFLITQKCIFKMEKLHLGGKAPAIFIASDFYFD